MWKSHRENDELFFFKADERWTLRERQFYEEVFGVFPQKLFISPDFAVYWRKLERFKIRSRRGRDGKRRVYGVYKASSI